MNTDKILALATYVRHRDGDALASPVHRAYMKEMSEWLERLVVVWQKEHLEYLHETWHPDDKQWFEEITDQAFVDYWKCRNEEYDKGEQ
jgi:hypothetical protein